MVFARKWVWVWVLGIAFQSAAEVELVRLDASNFEAYAPAGKEADANYGDYVLRNDALVAVIADPIPGRNANMMTRNVGGAILDLTARDNESDQLSAYFPIDPQTPLEYDSYAVNGHEQARPVGGAPLRGDHVALNLRTQSGGGRPDALVQYILTSDARALIVETRYMGVTDDFAEFEVADSIRFDNSRDGVAVERKPNGEGDFFWLYDKWFGQAYGVLYSHGTMRYGARDTGRAATRLAYTFDGKERVALTRGQELIVRRHVIPASTQVEVRGIAQSILGGSPRPLGVWVTDKAGRRIPDADVVFKKGGEVYGWGRTNRRGVLTTELPSGSWEVSAKTEARGEALRYVNPADVSGITLELDEPGFVAARVRDSEGRGLPAKVQFYGKDGVADPFFGPDSGGHGVHNVHYSHNGTFEIELAPGTYDVVVSRGPEYDAYETELEVLRGQTAFLEGSLDRVIDTPGWISADYHSHSSPSGDNTSSQYGRVLNLLCEHVEFAPCTEHNRLDTYDEHLERLGAASLLASCVGMELTSSPGDLNHQNAFPLILKEHTQDGGGPLTSRDPEEQIKRLALWDDGSEKLVQQNHPDLAEMFFDRNDDGVPDEGYNRMPEYMDVIEIHPPAEIFGYPFIDTLPEGTDPENPPRNRMHTWVQLINLGRYMPGVVNTDAHANFHGSGWIRNYVRSSTDDPNNIDVMEMVRASSNGHVVMTTGPYLEAEITAENPGRRRSGGPGDTVNVRGGNAKLWIRVQCPNWFDINRVQVLVNGRYREDLNFTREGRASGFDNGIVKFETEVEMTFDTDAHVIVATIGENETLGRVYGESRGKMKPVAVTNPIFIDIDGDGFEPNGDTLDQPLVP